VACEGWDLEPRLRAGATGTVPRSANFLDLRRIHAESRNASAPLRADRVSNCTNPHLHKRVRSPLDARNTSRGASRPGEYDFREVPQNPNVAITPNQTERILVGEVHVRFVLSPAACCPSRFGELCQIPTDTIVPEGELGLHTI